MVVIHRIVALVLLAAVVAAQGVQPPARFERVLWCSDAAAGPKYASEHGYTAVQLGRGGDPEPLRALGLGFYVDQPIGKGMLELRDQQWQPVVQQFERTRNAGSLVRPGCFARPGALDQAAAAAAAEVRRIGRDGMLFVALADEASSTRHNAPLDTCRCEHCLRDFRAFARQRFGSVDRLNAALGTHFPSFDAAVPLSTDQVRRRELGDQLLPADLRPFSLWLDFVDAQFADGVRTILERVRAAVPDVPIGLTGLNVPGPFGGHDYQRLLPGHTLAEPYDIGGSIELARSLLPAGAHRYRTLFPPAAGSPAASVPLARYVRARIAAMASHGVAGMVVWNDRTVADEAGAASSFGQAVQNAMRQLGESCDQLAGAAIEPSSIWLVESHPSVRAWWMLDSAGDGMTWVRRLASYEQTHSTSQAARVGWLRLLQDLGHQPSFVASVALPERLLIERPRCVVLPAMLALSDRCLRALTIYVRGGGTVIADHSTALYDDQLQRRERGGLDGLFGIAERSLQWNDLLVREGRSTARAISLPSAERGLRGVMADRQSDGDGFLENSVGRGRAYYLNAPVVAYDSWRLVPEHIKSAQELRRRVRGALQRAGVLPPCDVTGEGLPTCIERVRLRLRDGRNVIAVRVNALQDPRLLQQLAENGPLDVELIWPRAVECRELTGRDHGVTARCKTTLDAFGALFVEVRG